MHFSVPSASRRFIGTSEEKVMDKNAKILIPGGAGLVGQNTVTDLINQGYKNLVVLDKHVRNTEFLREMHPDITVVTVDLADKGSWADYFEGADVVVQLQAQIGASSLEPFIRNNIESTKNIIEVIKKYNIPYTIHFSSSVVKSVADDWYTNTKKEQEKLVVESGIKCSILRPTLMFGWFDRKHLGWLSRFMNKTPIFPIPGNGKYMRQPLYAGDMSNIVISCMHKQIEGAYDISGLEKVDYIDIIREIKKATNSKTLITKIPYSMFYALLAIYAVFDKDPPFTTQQLAALVAHDEFDVIDWPAIFDIKPTKFADAIYKTFNDPKYSKIVLDF